IFDPSYSILKGLLQEVDPSEIRIHSSSSKALCDAVVSVCGESPIYNSRKTLFEGGRMRYKMLSKSGPNIVNPSEKSLCLAAFAALVDFTEQVRDESLSPSSCTISFHQKSHSMVCPLCEEKERVELKSLEDVKVHFARNHWQVHGYACHGCGMTYSTVNELTSGHTCEKWEEWKAMRNWLVPEISMKCAISLLCCAECGWHTSLGSTKNEEEEDETMKHIHTFLNHHKNDRLLTMVVYFGRHPTDELTSLKFPMTSTAGGDPLKPCSRCSSPKPTFRNPIETSDHCREVHRGPKQICEVCNKRMTTPYYLELHQMEHVGDNSYFADYLSNITRIFPPPKNLCDAPRSGWKDGLKGPMAVGGIIRGFSNNGFDMIEPTEDVRVEKARMIAKRKAEGERVNERGFEDAPIEMESEMAREVREKV
ncbi:hypothetical protein PMAYCL1PPCAC_31534, partial [Pristionchus mayeri]